MTEPNVGAEELLSRSLDYIAGIFGLDAETEIVFRERGQGGRTLKILRRDENWRLHWLVDHGAIEARRRERLDRAAPSFRGEIAELVGRLRALDEALADQAAPASSESEERP